MVNQKPLSFSPSTAERWAHCKAYPILRARSNLIIEENPTALEGKKAHFLAASILELNKIGINLTENSFFKKANLDRIQKKLLTYNKERAENEKALEISSDEMKEFIPYVFYYIDYIIKNGLLVNAEYYIEQFFAVGDFKKLYVDFVSYKAETDELHVVDLKFGKGLPVKAFDNYQLAIYAFAASSYITKPISKITVHIVQPRIPFGKKESDFTYSPESLQEFLIPINNAMISIRRLYDKQVKLKAKHYYIESTTCGFCELKMACPELGKELLDIAKKDFSIIPQLSPKELFKIYKQWRAITGFLYAVKGHLTNAIYSGSLESDEFKTVKSLSNRKWKNQKDAEKYLQKHFGDKIMTKPELLSPAQVEQITGGDFIKDLIIREEKEIALVPIEDIRESVSILREFNKIEGK